MGSFGTPVAELRLPPRAGRPFEPVRERQLDSALRSLARTLPGADGGIVLSPEFVGPRGVVDLLAVTRLGDSLERRLAVGPPFLTSEADCSVVMATLVAATRTSSHIARKLGISERQAERRLRDLTARGFIHRVGAGFRRHPSLVATGRAYALEAKVRDWRRGLEQALRYASWSDAAGVVLLLAPTSPAPVLSIFRSFGIGLAVGDTWLVRPRIGHPDPGRRLLLAESLASGMAAAHRVAG